MTSTQLLVVILASAAGATVKSVTGMGYPVISVPLIALVAGVPDAVVVVAIPNLAANVYMCWESRDGRAESRDLGRLVGWGTVGAVIGTIALVRLPNDPLMVLLAAMIVAFVVQFLRNPTLQLDASTTHKWSPVAGFIAGCMQGSIGVSGPVVGAWMHGYRLPMRAYIHSVTFIFGVTGFVQLVILLGQGQMTSDRAVAMVCAGVTVSVVIPIGTRLRSRIEGNTFSYLVLGVLTFSAVSLLAQVIF